MGKETICSCCGREAVGGMLVSARSASQTTSAKLICGRCAADQDAASITSLEEIDSLIKDVSEQLAILEKIIGKVPKMSAVPGGLAAFAMTPLSVFGTLQDLLAAYKSRRMELMTEKDSQARLKYELDKAIESEDYERAAELNNKLNP